MRNKRRACNLRMVMGLGKKIKVFKQVNTVCTLGTQYPQLSCPKTAKVETVENQVILTVFTLF